MKKEYEITERLEGKQKLYVLKVIQGEDLVEAHQFATLFEAIARIPQDEVEACVLKYSNKQLSLF